MRSTEEFWGLLRAQHGLALTNQAFALGVTKGRLRAMIADRSLSRVAYGVIAATGAPETPEYLAMFGLLLAGPRRPEQGVRVALCDITAAVRHDLIDPILKEPVHVLSTRRLDEREGYVFHWSSRLPENEIVLVDNLSTTDAARTFIDLCSSQAHRAFSIFRRGLRRSAFTREEVAERIDRESRQGRGGLQRARFVLELTDPTADKARSGLEDHFFDLLVRAGYPPPERNASVRGLNQVWEVDLFWRHRSGGLEVSPSWYHGDPWVLTKDHRKLSDLRAAGVDIYTVTELMSDAEVLAGVRQMFGPPESFSASKGSYSNPIPTQNRG